MSTNNWNNPNNPQHPYNAQPGQPYGAPGAYGPAGQTHPQAQTVFILGIVGIFIGLCALIAWFMGNKAKKEIEQGAPYTWSGNLKTGYMLGMIFSIIYIVLLVFSIIINISALS